MKEVKAAAEVTPAPQDAVAGAADLMGKGKARRQLHELPACTLADRFQAFVQQRGHYVGLRGAEAPAQSAQLRDERSRKLDGHQPHGCRRAPFQIRKPQFRPWRHVRSSFHQSSQVARILVVHQAV